MIHSAAKGVLGHKQFHLLGCTSSWKNWSGRRKHSFVKSAEWEFSYLL